MKGFARREFELVLLRRMADYQPDLVAAAVRSLDASPTEMREVNARWQRLLRSRAFQRGRDRLAAVLGPAAGIEERRLGDVVCRAEWWELPLWPGLWFEALMGPDGSILQEWLVRAKGVPVPRLAGVEDLEPWSCVVGDLDQRFGPAGHRPGEGPSRWHVRFSAPDGGSYVAHFVWGLLQAVEPV